MLHNFNDIAQEARKKNAKDAQKLEYLSSTIDRYEELRLLSAWIEHPKTQSLLETIENRLGVINQALLENRDMTDIQRAGLFAEKDSIKIILAEFEPPTSEMETIETRVQELL